MEERCPSLLLTSTRTRRNRCFTALSRSGYLPFLAGAAHGRVRRQRCRARGQGAPRPVRAAADATARRGHGRPRAGRRRDAAAHPLGR
eukprot:4170450-Prymnesium_polylepis.1